MNSIQHVSRRSFLEGIFSTGALILGAQVLPETLRAGEVDNAAWDGHSDLAADGAGG
jgi:hypothetical protein